MKIRRNREISFLKLVIFSAVILFFEIGFLSSMEESEQEKIYGKFLENAQKFDFASIERFDDRFGLDNGLQCVARNFGMILYQHVDRLEEISDGKRRNEICKLLGENIKKSGYDVNYKYKDEIDRKFYFLFEILHWLVAHNAHYFLILFYAGANIELTSNQYYSSQEPPLFFYGVHLTLASYDFLSIVLPTAKNPKVVDKKGKNLFHWLIEQSDVYTNPNYHVTEKIIDLFLSYNIDINAVAFCQGKRGTICKSYTPLDMMIEHRSHYQKEWNRIIKLFRKKGALKACELKNEEIEEL